MVSLNAVAAWKGFEGLSNKICDRNGSSALCAPAPRLPRSKAKSLTTKQPLLAFLARIKSKSNLDFYARIVSCQSKNAKIGNLMIFRRSGHASDCDRCRVG